MGAYNALIYANVPIDEAKKVVARCGGIIQSTNTPSRSPDNPLAGHFHVITFTGNEEVAEEVRLVGCVASVATNLETATAH